MKKFFLAGQTGFGNRGCEALVRSTCLLLKEKFGDVILFTPSFNADADRKQWPQAEKVGIRFVNVPAFPEKLRWWGRINRITPRINHFWLPRSYSLDRETLKLLSEIDGVIMIGGDVITLDYGLAPLFWHTGFAEICIKKNIPVTLWAASSGPFAKNKIIERYMAGFLDRLSAITVRETTTQQYLTSIGVTKNVTLVADPAFVLPKEEFNVDGMLPRNPGKGIVGFNLSPVIQKFRPASEAPAMLKKEVSQFLRGVINEKGFSVVLIPHVDSLDGRGEMTNRDSLYMADLFASLSDLSDHITMASPTMNACQLKYLISKCRFFIGGRTHATIGSLSSGVPTISIAYSVKAKGINKDLFGHDRYVLDTPDVSNATLRSTFNTICNEEGAIRDVLALRNEDWKRRAAKSADALWKVIDELDSNAPCTATTLNQAAFAK